MMLEHITKCAKAPKYYESETSKVKFVDEDFRPEQFFGKDLKQAKAGRLSEIVRGNKVTLFGESAKFSVSVENLSSANSVNKSVRGETQSSFINAVKLLILQGWDAVIKQMFVIDHQSTAGCYDDRIKSGMHQVRLYINGEQKVITVDDFVPQINEMPSCNMTCTAGELWISILEKAFAKLFQGYEKLI